MKACVYLGECEVQLDHVYERKNILRVLGLNMERPVNSIYRETGIETKTNIREFELFATVISFFPVKKILVHHRRVHKNHEPGARDHSKEHHQQRNPNQGF